MASTRSITHNVYVDVLGDVKASEALKRIDGDNWTHPTVKKLAILPLYWIEKGMTRYWDDKAYLASLKEEYGLDGKYAIESKQAYKDLLKEVQARLLEERRAVKLPDLNGSEKQVKWAQDIRHNFVETCETLYQFPDAIKGLETVTDAKLYIDNRHESRDIIDALAASVQEVK